MLNLSTNILFHEKQKFTQWWLWLLLLFPLGHILFVFFSPIFTGLESTSGNLSLSLIMSRDNWIILFITLFIALLFLMVRMETKIDSDKIRVKHLFFVKKTFPFEEIKSVELITYGFVGYGIRISLKHGTVYNVKGNKGLFLTLKNGKKYLIGTQRPDEMGKVVEKLRSL